MIYQDIYELVQYGIKYHLILPEDKVYVTNRILELLNLDNYIEEISKEETIRPLCIILDSITEYAVENKILCEDTITGRDLFDTKLMGLLTPPPSKVRETFFHNYEQSSKLATDTYYEFSKATNYIRTDRIVKDEKWETKTPYGTMDITINLSKPEKDPRDIIKAGSIKQTGYPKCLLCKENEGYAGHFSHPARQNHRIIPMKLDGEKYYMQYSPYVYYNEHCIIFNEKHTPMKIDKSTFVKLLEFVEKFPHYMLGSNADLPIVGGSILSHDHFQGGSYEFAMTRARCEKMFTMKDFPSVRAGIVKWPMSVIRLMGENPEEISEAAWHILEIWRDYTDREADIISHTENIPHNTITPIARKKEGVFEMDLVLRNNRTTEEYPMGIFHPHKEYHNIKKENIGLIEVMGLAVLPARLKKEMEILKDAILQRKDIASIEEIKKHKAWAEAFLPLCKADEENIDFILRDEIGKTFVKVLQCCGVFKEDEKGKEAFERFLSKL